MSVCLSVCVFVCSRAQAAKVTYMISLWYQHVRHRLGSVLKKVSDRFDHICGCDGRKRVEKHGFLGIFHPFSVRFVSKGFQYDFCGMYWLWVGSSYCGEYFRVVSSRFNHTLGHFRTKFAKNGQKWAKLFFLKFIPNYFLMVFRCKMGWFWPFFMERGLKEVVFP